MPTTQNKDNAYVLKVAKDLNVKFIRLWFTDILGFLKSVAITIEGLEEALEEGVGFDGSAIEGFTRIDESDMVAMPDPNTFSVLPWWPEENDVARMFCSPEGKALEIMQERNLLGRPLYVVASAEEFPEMENINRLAGGYVKVGRYYIRRFATTFEKDMVLLTQWLKMRGIESYYIQIYQDYYTVWYLEDQYDPSMQEALLLRFLPLGTGHGQEIGYFTPAFQSPEAHVWVYRFVPEGVPVRRINREGARHFGGHD